MDCCLMHIFHTLFTSSDISQELEKLKVSRYSFNMTIVEMSVSMDCAGCESKIKKALQKLDGVDDVEVDMAMQKVTVMGWADQMKVLKTVRKTGRRAELWPFPYNPEYHDFTNHYYNNNNNINYHNYYQTQPENNYNNNYYSTFDDDHSSNDYHQSFSVSASTSMMGSTSSYNYREHGYNGHDHGYYLQPPHLAGFNERTSNLFSDDNPNACSIM